MTTQTALALTDEYCIKEFGWSKARFETIQRSYFKDLSFDDIVVFGHVCKHVGLDPFLKQIYPVVRTTKQPDGTKKPTMSIQTGIDGFRAVAERTGRYSPGKEPLFKYDKDGRLHSATAYVMKMTADGKWHEVAATAIYNEYKPAYPNDFWSLKPHIMLSKCAEALAIRKAFPADLSGVYSKEELEQADVFDPHEGEKTAHQKHKEIEVKDAEKKILMLEVTPVAQGPSAEEEPKLSFDQVTEVMKGLAQTDDTFKTNYKKYMQEKWGVSQEEYLPLKAYVPTMTAIQRNIEFNLQKQKAV